MYRYLFRLIQVIDFECFKYNKKSISLAGGVCVLCCFSVSSYHHEQSACGRAADGRVVVPP
jgi:hypothetical protein